MRIIGFIAARGGSKRLPRKNVLMINGKPMIAYTIDACKKSKLLNDFYVTTEDKEIKETALRYGAKVLDRPMELAGDNVGIQVVMKHFATKVDFDILVLVQPNSPNIKSEKIDEAISMILKNPKMLEVRSFFSDGTESSSVWVLRKEAVLSDRVSVYLGMVIDNSVDIHTFEDFEKAEKMLKEDIVRR